ncbi:rCG28655 [Rattus norvegicus]|uniref:RCG28655 n=1 Tax=Rattus norvegicus TaxID=10116 RepID=A6HV56_RAT|nr:rCG28655 [Rattus norvegicus]
MAIWKMNISDFSEFILLTIENMSFWANQRDYNKEGSQDLTEA